MSGRRDEVEVSATVAGRQRPAGFVCTEVARRGLEGDGRGARGYALPWFGVTDEHGLCACWQWQLPTVGPSHREERGPCRTASSRARSVLEVSSLLRRLNETRVRRCAPHAAIWLTRRASFPGCTFEQPVLRSGCCTIHPGARCRSRRPTMGWMSTTVRGATKSRLDMAHASLVSCVVEVEPSRREEEIDLAGPTIALRTPSRRR